MLFPRAGGLVRFDVPRSQLNYQKTVGDGTSSSVFMAPLRWIGRTFPEAPLRLREYVSQDELGDPLVGHELLKLMRRPNPYYSGQAFLKAMTLSYNADGNAYAMIVRNRFGLPVQLWWVPHQLMEPKREEGSRNFIDYFEYQTGDGLPTKVPPSDVFHWRDGVDPMNTMKGMSPMKGLLREVFTDDEAAQFTAQLLRNMGVPGLVMSPADESMSFGSDDDKRSLKRKLKAATTGDGRGEPVILDGAVKLEQFGFTPQQMDLKALRRLPEERVTATLGVPAIVCGLGAGLDRSTFANFEEAVKQAWEGKLVPDLREYASEVQHQLLPAFEADPDRFLVDHDYTNVRAMQDDQDALAERMVKVVNGGLATVREGREKLGMPVDESHDIYLRPLNLIEVRADELGQKPDPVDPPEDDPKPDPADDADEGDGAGDDADPFGSGAAS